MITVTVVYALPDQQWQKELHVERGTTANEAVQMSGVIEEFAELSSGDLSLGIYARLLDGRMNPAASEYVLTDFDRVEIYRPLHIDPKQARLLRAERARAKAGQPERRRRNSRPVSDSQEQHDQKSK